MNAWKIGVIAWVCFGALVVVGNIGKPRKATTPGVAVIVLLLDAALIYAVLRA